MAYQCRKTTVLRQPAPMLALQARRKNLGFRRTTPDWDASDYEVTLTGDEMLDMRWCEEGQPSKDAGSLREWLAEAKEPGWLNGSEP